jgi:sterol desaturase/sphingolipid hydroxylase (fatty acid hydroxylase superfamily)
MFILQVLGWFVFSCILMSFIEYQVHSRLMHRRSIERFKKTFVAHAITHHTNDYGDIFADEPVPPGEDREIRLTTRKAAIKGLPVIIPLAFVSWTGAVVFALTITLHHWIWNKIHLEMHKPEGRGFSRWPIYKFLARYHYLHHVYPNKNFNVVFPLFDYVFGTNAHATAAEREEMVKLGFLPAPAVAASSIHSRESELVGTKR